MSGKKTARAPTKKKKPLTIANRIKVDKEKVLEIATTVPFLGAVAKKAGVSRATLYRWRHEDGIFNDALIEAQVLGRENVNDMAESGLVKLIQNNNLPAIRTWLQHNHDRYRIRPSLHKDDALHKTIPAEILRRFVKMITAHKRKLKKVHVGEKRESGIKES